VNFAIFPSSTPALIPFFSAQHVVFRALQQEKFVEVEEVVSSF
jgi:hypothetical protein